jgi:hypothetical protein
LAKTLTEIALDEKLAEPAVLEDAARKADADDQPLVVSLIRHGGIGEVALVAALRRQIRVAIADPASIDLDSDALRELPREVCRRRRVLPLSVQVHGSGPRSLRLAMADPTDQVAVAEVEHITGARVIPTVMTLSAVEELIETGYRGFVTQVMKREGVSAYRRSAAVPTEPAPHSTTIPHHRVVDEADAGLRLEALEQVLVDKGLVTASELDEAVRNLLKGRDGKG